MDSIKLVIIGIAAIVVLIIGVAIWPFAVVHPGEKGIVIRAGKINRTLDPGFHVITPLVEGVVIMDIQTQKEQTDATAASSDLQTVKATVAINYNLEEEKVVDLYTRVGVNYSAKVIDPAVQEAVKASTAKYTAEELITKRPQVTEDISSALTEKLAQNDIKISSVSIINFDFSDTFNAAIEAKVTAEQNALAAKNKLAQVEYEKQQRIAQAQGEAEAIKIQASAISAQGGADYVQLKTIEKWNGQGCTSYCGMAASSGLLVTGK